MSRNAAGNYTLPSGNPVATGSTISSAVHNSTLADLAAEVTNSLDRQGRGAMQAPLKVQDGTVSAPGLTFGAETATGVYRPAANDVRVSVNGQDVAQFEPTGTTLPRGLEVTQSQANTVAVAITGTGSAVALSVSGGSGGAAAISAAGSGTNGRGATFTATGSETSVHATGGTASGPGGQFFGGLPNGNGLVADARGTGTGLVAIGGVSNGIGATATGSGNATGLVATGGATGGTGLAATGGATNGRGATLTGTGTESGVVGQGGATSGLGGAFTGGAPNGTGLTGTGVGNGSGGKFYNGASSTSAAVEGWSAAAASAGGFFSNLSTGAALHVDNGHIRMTGTISGPTATVTDKFLTPANLVRAWARIAFTGAGGSQTLVAGYNVSGAALTGASNEFLEVTFSGVTFASSTSWAPWVTLLTTAASWSNIIIAQATTTTTAQVAMTNAITGNRISLTTLNANHTVLVVALGF